MVRTSRRSSEVVLFLAVSLVVRAVGHVRLSRGADLLLHGLAHCRGARRGLKLHQLPQMLQAGSEAVASLLGLPACWYTQLEEVQLRSDSLQQQLSEAGAANTPVRYSGRHLLR